MAERSNPFQSDSQKNQFESTLNDATSRVKSDVQHLVEGFDLQSVAKRIEEFGKENPLGLAVSALTLGVAFGMLMKSARKMPMH